MADNITETQRKAALESDAVKALFPKSGILDVQRVSEKIVVSGESHMRFIKDEAEERKAQDLFDSADIIAVEFNPKSDDSGWSAYSPNKPFMEMAVETATEKGKQLINMHEQVADRFEVWQKAGINVTKEDFIFLKAVNTAYMHFRNPENPDMFQDSIGQTVQRVTEQLVQEEKLEEKQARTYAKAATVIRVASTNKRMQEVYSELDSIARDYVYANLAVNLKKANPDKSIVFVTGNAHTKALSDSLSFGAVVTSRPKPEDIDAAQGISVLVSSVGQAVYTKENKDVTK